jgi:hypothetical protein
VFRKAVNDSQPALVVEAEYMLENAVKCPHCWQPVESLQVVRLLRTKVNFTSTLPRRGHVLCCPRCQTIVSAALFGFA